MPTGILSPDATHTFLPAIRRVRTASRRGNAGLSLRMRRTWFAEGEGQTPPPNPTTPSNPAPGTQNPAPPNFPVNIDDETDITQFPESVQTYIKKLREENKTRRLKEKQAEDEKAAAEQKRLAEQGEWQKLAEQRAAELEGLKREKGRAEEYEAELKAINDARIKQIPEAMRKLVPANYQVRELSAWLNENLPLLTKSPAPGMDPGQKGERGKTPPDPKQTLKKTAY